MHVLLLGQKRLISGDNEGGGGGKGLGDLLALGPVGPAGQRNAL